MLLQGHEWDLGLLALQPLEEVCDVTAGKKVLHTEERHDPEAVTEETQVENLSLEKKGLVCGNQPDSDVSLGSHFVVQVTGGCHRFCS